MKAILDPWVIAALVLTVVNDHYLKWSYPHFVTGKISDFSGLFVAPFFFNAVVDFIKSPSEFTSVIYKKRFLTLIALTATLFITLKLTVLREMFSVLWSRYLFQIKITNDPSDLIALSILILSYFRAKKYFALESTKD